MGKDVSSILAIAEPIAAERGLEILDIELAGTIVRVLLDSPEETRRVGIDDCQAVSQRLGDGLDAHEVLKSGYMLEVSSPGLNKPLKKPEHFGRVLGKKVRVRAKEHGEDGSQWRTRLGRLDAVDESTITVVEDSGVATRIAFADVDRANLEFEFEQKPARNRRKRS